MRTAQPRRPAATTLAAATFIALSENHMTAASTAPEPATSAPAVLTAVPVLVVDRVEPCVAFWRDRLGFTVSAEVPHEGHLGFAMLTNGTVTLMYQSRASVEADLPEAARPLKEATTFLFVTVGDLNAVDRATAGAPRVMERRKTFYGMEEFAVRDPGGHVVTFAQRVG